MLAGEGLDDPPAHRGGIRLDVVRPRCLRALSSLRDVHAQTLWMLANPWSFVERVVARLTDGNLYAGIIATLGWGTIWIASSVYYLYWGGLIAAVVLDGSQDRLRLPISARRLP